MPLLPVLSGAPAFPAPPAGEEAGATGDGPLTDAQGRRITYLRLSVTDTCNYRCSYCSPANWDGRSRLLTVDEYMRLGRVFASLGVERVRLTGGEPLVRDDLEEIASALRSIGGIRELCLTTNGHRLADRAAALRAAGIDRLNVSLDTLDPVRFRAVTKTGDLTRVLDGIRAASRVGFSRLAVNVVVLEGVNDDAVSLSELVHFAWSHGAVPRFIERMPFNGRSAIVPVAAVRGRLEAAGFDLGVVGVRTGAGPARYARATARGGGAGEIGFIGAMTENFCEGCNRVRLAATGELRACLGGRAQVALAPLLRTGASDMAIATAIRAALATKWVRHRFVEDGPTGLLPMMGIGG